MPPKKRRFCQHCQEYVSIRTFQAHYDLYFNKRKNEWKKFEYSDEENGLQNDADLNNISLNTTNERATAAALVIKIKMKHNRNQVFSTFFDYRR